MSAPRHTRPSAEAAQARRGGAIADGTVESEGEDDREDLVRIRGGLTEGRDVDDGWAVGVEDGRDGLHGWLCAC